jgi:hypothetical protein
MDPIGWFIATLHQMLGHDKARMVVGAVSGPDEADCLLCEYETDPTPERKARVVAAIGKGAPDASGTDQPGRAG